MWLLLPHDAGCDHAGVSAPSRNLERWLDVVIRELGESVKEFHPIRVRLDGERACLVFRWCDDPNTYEMCSSVSGDVWSWDEIEDTIGLIEELRTGFLVRAIKTRSGPVLRADLDAEQSAHGSRNFYLSHYRSEWFGSAQPLADAGLDVGPGEAARNAGTLLDWCVAKANTRTGGPALGQLVTVRDSETEGQIAHLELTRQAVMTSAMTWCSRRSTMRRAAASTGCTARAIWSTSGRSSSRRHATGRTRSCTTSPPGT